MWASESRRDVHTAPAPGLNSVCAQTDPATGLPWGLQALLRSPRCVCVSRPGCCRPPQASRVCCPLALTLTSPFNSRVTSHLPFCSDGTTGKEQRHAPASRAAGLHTCSPAEKHRGFRKPILQTCDVHERGQQGCTSWALGRRRPPCGPAWLSSRAGRAPVQQQRRA